MKSASLSEEEKKAAVKDFNFPKGITIALLAGFMSGCFNVGLEFGKGISFPETAEMFRTLARHIPCDAGRFRHERHLLFLPEPEEQDLGRLQENRRMGE